MSIIIDYLRKRCLKKDASRIPTGLMSLDRVHSALSIIDVSDNSFNDCVEELHGFFRERGIREEFIYFDFRKLAKDETLITKVNNTLLRKEIGWYGKPAVSKVGPLLAPEYDLLVSLVRNDSFALEYVTKCARAKFKAGRKQIAGNVFDLVVSDGADAPCTEAESARHIIDYLLMLK